MFNTVSIIIESEKKIWRKIFSGSLKKKYLCKKKTNMEPCSKCNSTKLSCDLKCNLCNIECDTQDAYKYHKLLHKLQEYEKKVPEQQKKIIIKNDDAKEQYVTNLININNLSKMKDLYYADTDSVEFTTKDTVKKDNITNINVDEKYIFVTYIDTITYINSKVLRFEKFHCKQSNDFYSKKDVDYYDAFVEDVKNLFKKKN